MLALLQDTLARGNGIVIGRILTAGQKIANERSIIAADEIGVAIGGGDDGSFYIQPWTSITWIAVP